MIQYINLFLLFILVDREFVLRKRYKLAIENEDNYFSIWIYCDGSRYNGRRLYTYHKKNKK